MSTDKPQQGLKIQLQAIGNMLNQIDEQKTFSDDEPKLMNHSKQLLDGKDNTDKNDELMTIIGGIDEIIHLDEQQIQRIYQLLSSPAASDQRNKLAVSTTIKRNNNQLQNKEDTVTFSYIFDENDTFFHQIFQPKTVDKILTVASTKRTSFIVMVAFLIWRLLMFVDGDGLGTYTIFSILVNIIVFMPFLLCWNLAANKQGSVIILQSFEYWFRLINFLVGKTMVFIYNMRSSDKDVSGAGLLMNMKERNIDENEHHNQRHPTAYYCNMTVTYIVGILLFNVISFLDAHQIQTHWKIIFSGVMALLFFQYAASFRLLLHNNHDDSVIEIIPDTIFKFSLISQTITSYEILAIFYVKQAFLTYWRSRGETARSVLIKHYPGILWKKSVATQQLGQKNVINDENDDKTENKTVPQIHLNVLDQLQDVDNGDSRSGSWHSSDDVTLPSVITPN